MLMIPGLPYSVITCAEDGEIKATNFKGLYKSGPESILGKERFSSRLLTEDGLPFNVLDYNRDSKCIVTACDTCRVHLIPPSTLGV